MFHDVSLAVDEMDESLLAVGALVRSFTSVDSSVYQVVLLPREALQASLVLAVEWSLKCVGRPDVI